MSRRAREETDERLECALQFVIPRSLHGGAHSAIPHVAPRCKFWQGVRSHVYSRGHPPLADAHAGASDLNMSMERVLLTLEGDYPTLFNPEVLVSAGPSGHFGDPGPRSDWNNLPNETCSKSVTIAFHCHSQLVLLS
eukprot:5805078-Amphidinium_carterae.1